MKKTTSQSKCRVRKQRFFCGHIGFGKSCRRCWDAERYEALSETKPGSKQRKKYISKEKRKTSWLLNAECAKLEEMARHLAEDGKSGSFKPSTHPKFNEEKGK